MYQHTCLFLWKYKSSDYLRKVSRLFISSSALSLVVLQDVTNYGNFTFLALFNSLGAQTLNKLKHWQSNLSGYGTVLK